MVKESDGASQFDQSLVQWDMFVLLSRKRSMGCSLYCAVLIYHHSIAGTVQLQGRSR